MSKLGWSHETPQQGQTNVWLTPQYIISALGPFHLDPCAATVRPFDIAEVNYTVEDDGLSKPWNGFVFMNPPYGRETATWMDRLIEHNNGIALVFVRPDTAWSQRALQACSGALFLAGRIKFMQPDGTQPGTPGAPSMLLSFGELGLSRLQTCGLPGVLFTK